MNLYKKLSEIIELHKNHDNSGGYNALKTLDKLLSIKL